MAERRSTTCMVSLQPCGGLGSFNASHSAGLILFGLVFGFLASAHGNFLFESPFLLVVGLAMLIGWVVSARFIFSACL